MTEIYNTGTVSVASGTTTVTLSAGLWSDVRSGDEIQIADLPGRAIGSLTDATHLELATPIGVDVVGSVYTLVRNAPSRFTSGYLAEQVRALVARAGILEAARPNYEVQSLGANTPPGSPVTNDMYVVGTAPTGAWAGRANNLAQWTGSAWLFTAADHGVSVVSVATGVLSVWNGTTWLPYKAPTPYIETLMDDTTDAAARATLGGTAFRALGTLTGAAGSFARFTGTGDADAVMQAMVGTVSQSGGVPTGAIIESGSNANGSYTKFADGTMICSRRHLRIAGTITANSFVSLGSYVFPVAFSAPPVVTSSYDGGWAPYIVSSITGVSATGISAAYFSNLSGTDRATTDPTFHYIAIGRWF